MRSVFARSYVAAPPRVPRAQRGQCPSLLRSSVRPLFFSPSRAMPAVILGVAFPVPALPLLHDVGADNKDVCRSLQATTTAAAGQSLINNTCCLHIIPAHQQTQSRTENKEISLKKNSSPFVESKTDPEGGGANEWMADKSGLLAMMDWDRRAS